VHTEGPQFEPGSTHFFFSSTTMYLFELPTTGAVTFSDFCIDLSNEKAYTFHFSDATQARANLRGILKGSKRTDHNEKDYLSLVKVLLLMSWWILFSLISIRPSDYRGICASYLRYIEMCRPRRNRCQSGTKCVGPSVFLRNCKPIK
jgi:hypothetical protein